MSDTTLLPLVPSDSEVTGIVEGLAQYEGDRPEKTGTAKPLRVLVSYSESPV